MMSRSKLLATGHFVILVLWSYSYFTVKTISAFSTISNIGSTFTVTPQTRTSRRGTATATVSSPTSYHPFTFHLSKHQDANVEDEDHDRSFLQKLTSLFDEAVLLCSKVESSEYDEVQYLIENIAIALQMTKNSESIKNINLNLNETMEKKKRRTVEEVRYELDQAVINLQKLAVQDEEEKWTKMIEKLAIEYHEVLQSLSQEIQSDKVIVQEKDIPMSVEDVFVSLQSKLNELKVLNNANSVGTTIGIQENQQSDGKISRSHTMQQSKSQQHITTIDVQKQNLAKRVHHDSEKPIGSSIMPESQQQQLYGETKTQSYTKIQSRPIITKTTTKTEEQGKTANESLKTHDIKTHSQFEISESNESELAVESDGATSVAFSNKKDEEPKSQQSFTSNTDSVGVEDNKKDEDNRLVDKQGETNTSSLEIDSSLPSKVSPTGSNIREETKKNDNVEEVDIAIIGAGFGGLCAGAILNTLYNKKVGIYESHYLAGGCAHAFPSTMVEKDNKKEKMIFTFDSGPTIVLGCSTKPYNPLRQVLNAVNLGQEVEWIPYQGWGMVEHPLKEEKELKWKVDLGPKLFEEGPLLEFGGEEAVDEFKKLRDVTKVLVSGAVEIPAMAMRSGNSALIPLLRYLPALTGLISQGEEVTQGTFGQFLDGPKFTVKNQWLRDWLDALAFSLSGLPACRTSAAAMAYVIYDMHREGAALDYPKGGLGSVVDALVKGVEQGSNGSSVNLRQHVENIDISPDGSYIKGLVLKNGKRIVAKDGVICNAPVWCLNSLVKNNEARKVLNNFLPSNKTRTPRQTWIVSNDGNPSKILYDRPEVDKENENSLLAKCDTSEQTGSFLHLHIALDANGLDLNSMEAHYTVMDRGLGGDGRIVDGYVDGPCGELNMIAVSNPCVLDRSLAPSGYIVVHAYGAGNEPYDIWKGLDRKSPEYKALKEDRAKALWRAVESVIPDVQERVVLSQIGSPLTHERFLRRPRGTYGASTEDYLKDGSTPYDRLILCGDGIFPGIGIPAVALSGASAANSMISPWQQWKCLDTLKSKKVI